MAPTGVVFITAQNRLSTDGGLIYDIGTGKLTATNIRITSLAGGGNRAVMVDNNGDLYA